MTVIDFVSAILTKPFFTQQEIASLLNVDQSLVANWKTKNRKINSDNFLKLCDILGYKRTAWINGDTTSSVGNIYYKAESIGVNDLPVFAKLNKLATNLLTLKEKLNDK